VWSILKRFFRVYIFPRKYKFLLVQAMHLVAVFLLLAPPLIIRHIIDNVLPKKDVTPLLIAVGAIVGIYAVWAVISVFKEYWGHEVAQRVTCWLRNDLYGHFQKLSMSFHEEKKTGELLSRIVDDINVIEEVAHHGPETLIGAGVLILGSGAVLFYMDWRLALASLAVVPVLVVFARKMSKGMWAAFRDVRERIASLSDELAEKLSGMRVVQAFVGEEREAEAVSRANERHYRSRMNVIRWVAVLFPGSMFLNNVGVAVALLFGGILYMSDGLTIGTLTAFVFYLQRFLYPIMHLMMMLETTGRFFAGTERFFDYMDIEPDIKDAPDAAELAEVEGEIRLESVRFRYDRDRVLDGVDLIARAGQMVALVGPSGAGKTTITRLIPRFYDPEEGRVLVDGKDVRTLRLRSLRSHIAMVMQDDFLFSGTVAENIAYGRPAATREEIAQAAHLANAAPFIEQLPDGYDTAIGKRGVKLSEGQRQRVSIARAILRDPQILLLDEATSSVDTETEMLIQQGFEHLRTGRTTFVIAHRLSTILEADRILFVDGGRIVERGTHKELMELKGQYARFYCLQFRTELSAQ